MLGSLYAVQGTAVGACSDCGNVRACNVFLRQDGSDVLLCGECEENHNVRAKDKGLSLSEAKRRIREHRGDVNGWDV